MRFSKSVLPKIFLILFINQIFFYTAKTESAEKIKWSRPSHKIERNEIAKEKGKAIKNGFEPRKVVSVKKL